MTYVSIMLLIIGQITVALVILFSLLGRIGPKWSQRWGNPIVVLSLIALLIKTDTPVDNVWFQYLERWSICLGIFGSFWATLGDVVCSTIRNQRGWKANLEDAVKE